LALGQLRPLNVAQQRRFDIGLEANWKYRPAQRPSQAHLEQAPLGLDGGHAAEKDHCVGTAELSVQLLLPISPDRNALFGVKIHKKRRESCGLQLPVEPLGCGTIPAAVTDEQ
jgi:hypothetical protein